MQQLLTQRSQINMDYNNIILELLDRIKTLENKVAELENILIMKNQFHKTLIKKKKTTIHHINLKMIC